MYNVKSYVLAAADAKLEHYQALVQLLEKELAEYVDSDLYLHKAFNVRMTALVENADNTFMKEHYVDSPTYKGYSNKGVIDTLMWLSYSDEEKKKVLDDEMDNFAFLRKI
jgi:hypothetical protein